ncbi:cholesterol esterase, partial [Dimargaris verticillata]
MPRIPILGRLSFMEYQSLIVTYILILSEKVFRLFLWFIPVRWVLTHLMSPRYSPPSDPDTDALYECHDFGDFVRHWSYPVEEHTVVTQDGYILGIHRIPDSPLCTKTRSPDAACRRRVLNPKPVILLWHGFMMSSEVFVCPPDRQNILPLALTDAGYDVWLGNTRGNKYSYRHLTRKTWQSKFWDFSLDEMAMFDVPDTVHHILQVTGAHSLVYVGFSQGTAQMFCALASNRLLNDKVSLFVALAPATTPRGFDNDIVNAMIKTSPQVLYLMLGRKEALSIALVWKEMLSRSLHVWIYDRCLRFLFGWQCRNITAQAKHICYDHLYSFASVKSIVHWMQIIRTGKLQFYDDVPPNASPVFRTGHFCHRYVTAQIETPIVLFHGGQDSLSSIEKLIGHEIRAPLFVKEVPHYEHL